MRFAVLADSHVGRAMPLAIATHRREAFCEAFTKAVDKIIEANVDYIFICGDLFERKTLRPQLVPFVHQELYRLAREHRDQHGKEVKIFVIRGNHDGSPLSSALHYINHPLASYLVLLENGKTFSDDRIFVVGMGYYDQVERAFDEVMKPLFEKAKKGDKLRILLLHSFIGNYHDVPPNSPYLKLDKISEIAADIILAGHYHEKCDPKRIGDSQWLLTPGSLEMYDFGERPEKGFYIVDVDRGRDPAFQWVAIEPKHIMNRVEIKGRKETPDWYRDQILQAVKSFDKELRARSKQGYIRVVTKGKLAQGFPTDIDLSELAELQENNPLLLHVDVDTMDLELPPLLVSSERGRINVKEFFKEFGDFADEIQEMHRRVEDILEEQASLQTGLLPSSDRAPLVVEWLDRLKSRAFRGEG